MAESNPRRRKRRGGSRRRSYRRRNPIGYPMIQEVAYQNPENILTETLTSGSEITHHVSVMDMGVAAASLMANSHAVKYLNLAGGASVMASFVFPFVSAALVGMAHPRFGTMTFLGGEIEAVLKFFGLISGQQPIGLKPVNGDWVLQTPAPLLGLPMPSAGARQIYNPEPVILGADVRRRPSSTVVL